jgi:Sec-independent protein secretion pathway component TatC
MRKVALLVMFFMALFCTMAPSAMAYVRPTEGQVGYQIYNFVANDLLGGPIGVVCAVLFLSIVTFWIARSNIYYAVGPFVACFFLISIQAIAWSMGATL